MSDLKSSAHVRFYTCTLPAAESVMSPCDRPLFTWAESLPVSQRPTALEAELQRIRNDADQARYQQWARCEASRYAPPPMSITGVNVAIRGRLEKATGAHAEKQNAEKQTERQKAKFSVHFSQGTHNAPPVPPAGCPPLPFPLLHEMKSLGINHYPQNTRITFMDSDECQYYNGIGPWEGSKVFMVWTPREAVRYPMNYSFRFSMRIESEKIFDHWVTFRTVAEADLPQQLQDRLEPFSAAALDLRTPVAFDWGQPEGQRGHGWRVVHEYTHLDSGRSWTTECFD